MLLIPHEIVRQAAQIARRLADQACRAGEPDHAAYFERVAADADRRADRLHALLDMRRPGRTRCAEGLASRLAIFSVPS
jgi:hypothetical protein